MSRRTFEVDVAAHLREPGVRHPLRREVELPGLAVSSASVPDSATVELDLVIEAIGSELVVEGRLRAPWQGECRRCLELVEGELDVPVREIFERRPHEGETYPLGDDVIDLEPMLRDLLVLALPLAPLCEQGCAGPAPDRFPALRPDEVADGDEAGDPPRDPRWAALDDLEIDEREP